LASGQFRLKVVLARDLFSELTRLNPAEVLAARDIQVDHAALTVLPAWHFDAAAGADTLRRQFGLATLDGLNFPDDESAQQALCATAGALLGYAGHTQAGALAHVALPAVEGADEFIAIDAATRRNLELTQTLRGEPAPTLLSVLDGCITSMGSRLMRQWVANPLRSGADAGARSQAVGALLASPTGVSAPREVLKRMADIERIATRIALRSVRPRELAALRNALEALPDLRHALPENAHWEGISELLLAPENILVALSAIAPEPAALLREGGVIAEGVDTALDELRGLQTNAGDFLVALEAREKARTQIPNLRVEYNKVHGFYIEITNSHAAKVPDDYRRRQTLKNAERYITPELKAFEDKALSAEAQALAREKLLYEQLIDTLSPYIGPLQAVARAVAQSDALAAFAERAQALGWVAPTLSDKPVIDIRAGRHPVVEAQLAKSGGNFIPNDCNLHPARKMMVVTGPNMGGKSTYMRQVALLAVLAYAGSYVPAAAATLGPIDRIYTRIGAADDLAQGRSTFMVEMTESAAILNGATEHSLVLMDEVGRGTSTFDGLALAWSIAQRLISHNRSYTLFATHYFELTQLVRDHKDVANVHLDAVEHGDKIVFMHAVQEGPASKSYGLAVAQLAGVPPPVIRAAKKRLTQLEEDAERQALLAAQPENAHQSALFGALAAKPPVHGHLEAVPSPALQALETLDPDAMTPRDALDALYRLKQLAADAP
jgi:DNA mismatch repair protein MutS